MKNLDRNERLIHDAFSEIKIDTESLEMRLHNKIQKGELHMNKPTRRAFSTLAAAIAILVLITATALAATIGPFERLATIIDPEDIETLIPVEISNEEQMIADGIRITWVAARAFDNIVDVYFTLEDLESNRLDGDFWIQSSVQPTYWRELLENWREGDPLLRMSSWSDGHEIIHRDTDGKVTLRMRHYFYSDLPTEGLSLEFGAWEITFDDFREGFRAANVDLMEFAVATSVETRAVPSMGVSGVSGSGLGFLINYVFDELMDGQLSVLANQNLDIDLGINRIDTTISSIGIVDGRLHVQTYNPSAGTSWVSIFLYRGTIDGVVCISTLDYTNLVDSASVRFNLNPDGTFCDNLRSDLRFTETIFAVDLDNLHEYTLIFDATGNQRIPLNWRVIFDISEHQ